MSMRRLLTAALLAGGLAMLGGCDSLEKEIWAPQEPNALSIDKDGVITEYIQETLDADYYSASELESMIHAEAAEYNKQYGEGKITVSEFVSEGKQVKVTLTYAEAEDYARFNNTEFFCGTMINAQLEGYLFDAKFQKIKNGSVQNVVPDSDVFKEIDEQVVILQAPMEVHVPGEVVYTTTNASMLAANDVKAEVSDMEDTVHELVLPSNDVYRKETNVTVEETKTANRVYIVYRN